MEDQMIFKIIVIIFLFLDFLHNWWIEDQVKEIAKKYNIKLKEYKQNNVVRKDFEKSINAHQGLLDLYQKEKEKREIAEENHKVLSLDIAQACKDLGLYEDTIIADELVVEINKKFISKDKIRELLEKYKYTQISDVDNIINFYKEIEELLEGQDE